MVKNKENSADNLRQLGDSDLKDKLLSARKALFELKFKKSEQKDPLKVRWARRSVARILTIMKDNTGETAKKGK
jgi:ribosomal protein L29